MGCPGARVADEAGTMVMGTLVADAVGGDTMLEGTAVEADCTAHAGTISSRPIVINRSIRLFFIFLYPLVGNFCLRWS